MSFLTTFCVSDSIFCLITTFLHFIRLEMKDAHEKFKFEICICRLARFGCRLLFGGKRSENDIRERSENPSFLLLTHAFHLHCVRRELSETGRY